MPVPERPCLVGVGVGPGDPELLTVRAMRTIAQADRVFSPSLAVDAVGRAESIVREADPGVEVERLVFAIDGDPETRGAAHDRAADRVVACLDAGERVAFVTLGDPNVYSTFTHLARAVRERSPASAIETVPGIMAFQELAALTGTVVLDGGERLCLVSAADGPEAFDQALGDPDAAIVVYKGGRRLPVLAQRLAAAGRLDGAVMGELLGLPGRRHGPVKAYSSRPAAYLATVLVPSRARAASTEDGEA